MCITRKFRHRRLQYCMYQENRSYSLQVGQSETEFSRAREHVRKWAWLLSVLVMTNHWTHFWHHPELYHFSPLIETTSPWSPLLVPFLQVLWTACILFEWFMMSRLCLKSHAFQYHTDDILSVPCWERLFWTTRSSTIKAFFDFLCWSA